MKTVLKITAAPTYRLGILLCLRSMAPRRKIKFAVSIRLIVSGRLTHSPFAMNAEMISVMI